MALALLGGTNSSDPAERCRIKEDPAGTRLMVAAHYEAETHSTAWLGDRDQMTGVIDVRLDRGDPIHLVLMTFRPIVYRFSGQVGRVRRLTLMSLDGAGAVGVPRHLVSFLPRCLNVREHKEEVEGFAEEVARLFGRRPHSIATSYALWRLQIGSRIEQLERKDRPPWSRTPGPETQRLLRWTPGGIARIDPAAVVTDVARGDYEVLPQEAGLRQLIASGAIVRATVAHAEAWEAAAGARGSKPIARPDIGYQQSYRVVRPIRIPAGLCGAHSADFYIPSLEYARGARCHSRLYLDDGTDLGTYRE
jgi:hypothetical protein